MSNRRNQLGDMTTNPGGPDVDASEDANTAVINPPSESQPTAPIPAEVRPPPAPRLKTAPYMIFDAVSAKDAEARKNPALHGTASEQLTAPGLPDDLANSPLTSSSAPPPPSPTAASPTIPGPGPKAPGASPKSAREILPVRGPEAIPMSNSNQELEPARRVVSATGAFVGGILAIAVVAGGALAGFMMKTPSVPTVPTIPAASTTPAPPSTPPAASTTTTTASAATTIAAPSTSPSSSASGSEPTTSPTALAGFEDKPLPKETGNKPSKTSLDRMLAVIKPVLTACVKGQAKAMYSVKITFDAATGRATDAQTFVPLTKSVAGGCVLGAAYDARVNPFAGPPFTAEVKFAP